MLFCFIFQEDSLHVYFAPNASQNPPSIPTLLIAQIVCFLRNTRLVIDWHNFGYSILALKLGDSHPLVRISQSYERTFARFATAHFCVSNAMGRVLKDEYAITTPILPLHDRPTLDFQPLSKSQRISFLAGLSETKPYITEIENNKLKLLVSSTSWTPDEDFSLLLDALVEYSKLAMHSHPHLPRLLAVITGKGPQKEYFREKIKQLEAEDKLEMTMVKTVWLTFEDYTKLLGAADLGISLHMSSSGVDLPMKVVDMFGAGLPVAGWSNFEAWSELVVEGVNGRGFTSAAQLEAILVDLFGSNNTQLKILQEGAANEQKRRWNDEWDPVAGRLFGLC